MTTAHMNSGLWEMLRLAREDYENCYTRSEAKKAPDSYLSFGTEIGYIYNCRNYLY